MIGTIFGHYEITGTLGGGGMGQVFRARDQRMGQDVAIKLLNPALLGNQQIVARFERELQVLLSLRAHPNIVTVYDYIESPFGLVMELIDGVELGERIAQQPTGLRPSELLATMRPLLQAVDFAHQKGVLHRDLKPANVMVARLGSHDQLKVMDFGIAGFVGGSSLTRTGTRMGTPLYMAPEQHLGGPVAVTTDIYSLGIMLFELVTGSPPFGGPSHSEFELMKAHIEQPIPAASLRVGKQIPALDAVIARATEKHPAQRFPTCVEFLAAIEAAVRADATGDDAWRPAAAGATGASAATLLDGPTPTPTPDPQPPQPVPPRPGPQPTRVGLRGWQVGLLVVLAVGSLGLGYVAATHGRDADAQGEDTASPESVIASPAAGAAAEAQAAAGSPTPVLRPITISAASATSISHGDPYAAHRAIDGDTETWWEEGVDGDGSGQSIRLTLGREATVHEIRIVPGYMKYRDDRYGDRWGLNNRVRRARFSFSSGASFVHEFADVRDWHTVAVESPTRARWIEITLLDFYPGYRANGERVHDSGISELQVWGE